MLLQLFIRSLGKDWVLVWLLLGEFRYVVRSIVIDDARIIIFLFLLLLIGLLVVQLPNICRDRIAIVKIHNFHHWLVFHRRLHIHDGVFNFKDLLWAYRLGKSKNLGVSQGVKVRIVSILVLNFLDFVESEIHFFLGNVVTKCQTWNFLHFGTKVLLLLIHKFDAEKLSRVEVPQPNWASLSLSLLFPL